MKVLASPARRRFLQQSAALAGGLAIAFHLPFRSRQAFAAEAPPKIHPPNAFIRIAPDGSVTLTINKSEMGQGVYTSLSMLLAEELEADWKKVRVKSAPVDAVYAHPAFGIQMTGGSTSVTSSWDQLRRVGAAARVMLVRAAAKKWNVAPEACQAENGFVILRGKGRKLGYGDLAELAAKEAVPQTVTLKDPKQFRLIGKRVRRLDTPDKLTGKAVFGQDVTLPGMLTALVARCPIFGGKLKDFDDRDARAIPGVKQIIAVPSGVVVLAEGFWAAKKGRDALKVNWDIPAGARISTGSLCQEYHALANKPGTPARQQGDASGTIARAEKKLEASYEVPYLAHAAMEPLNCVVDLQKDRCRVITGTQFQTVDRAAAAAVAGLKPEQVEIETTLLGGGFGRRANPASDFVVEAMHVAKAAGMPVKVMWTREDDMRGGYYRPLWADRIAAALDNKGHLAAWHHTIVGQSILAGTPFEPHMVKDGIDATSIEGAADLPYEIPHLLVDLHSPRVPVPVLWWRSVGHSHTAFVVEGFLDEMAHLAGKDPYGFRRDLLQEHPRHLAVLDLAAKKAGWGKPLPKGRGRGIAVHHSFQSYVAQVAEVSVSGNGFKVDRVVCAIDCGMVVNPSGVEAQMESAIAFALSAVLHGAITLKDGKVEQGNFHDYPILRMSEMPKVEVHILPSQEWPTGVGEPGTPPLAPAVANAIFSATGRRIRSLPIKL